MYDRPFAAGVRVLSLPGVNGAATDELNRVLDAGGDHVGVVDLNGVFSLFERSTGAFVPLPAKIRGRVWLSAPIDMTPPDTTITGGPSGSVVSNKASFTFVSSEAGSSFECRVDSGGFAPCTSPDSLAGLAFGAHTFAVRATDASNNTDLTPATRAWTVLGISRLSIRPSRFRAAPRGPSATAKLRTGARVRYRLSGAAKVRFTVQRRTTGRKVGKRCVRTRRANRRRPHCIRYAAVRGSFARSGHAGANSFHFTGRLRGRKLTPGRYRLLATPLAADGATGKSARASFRIKR